MNTLQTRGSEPTMTSWEMNSLQTRGSEPTTTSWERVCVFVYMHA